VTTWRLLPWLAAVALVSGCASKDTVAPPVELPEYTGEARAGTVWQNRTGSIFNERWVQLRPWQGDGAVVSANVGGQVTAWETQSGDRRWKRQFDGWISAGVGGQGRTAYVGTREGEVVALATGDGSVRWRRDVSGELVAAPAAARDYVVVRTVDGRVIALEQGSGERRWTYTSDVPSLSLRGNSRPVTVAGGVLVGLDNGRLVALQGEVGRPLWETQIQASEGSSPIDRLVDIDGSIGVGARVVYAATYQGELAQVSPREGEIEWSQPMSSYAGLRVDGERVYVTESNSHVRAVSSSDGTTLWRQDKLAHRRLTAPVAVPGTDYLVAGDYNGYLHVLARGDGRIVGRARPGDSFGILADAVPVGDGRVVVQARGGQLSLLEISARQ